MGVQSTIYFFWPLVALAGALSITPPSPTPPLVRITTSRLLPSSRPSTVSPDVLVVTHLKALIEAVRAERATQAAAVASVRTRVAAMENCLAAQANEMAKLRALFACPQPWEKAAANRCLFVEPRSTTRLQARKRCREMGGDLVTLHSAADHDLVRQFGLKKGILYFWSGLYKDKDGSLKWSDGSASGYRGVKVFYPKFRCYVDAPYLNLVGKRCTTRHPFMCQRPVPW